MAQITFYRKLIIFLISCILLLPIVFAANRYGVNICNKDFPCNKAEDYVCPGKFSDDSGKLPGPDACAYDDYDCCVEYNKTADVNNRLLMWNIPFAVDTCCGNAVNEYTVAEKISIFDKSDGQISFACCKSSVECVDDSVCFPSLEAGKDCKTNAQSCKDVNDDGTLEVCLSEKENTWEIIDTQQECNDYMGKGCKYINGKCECTTKVTVKVKGELKKGEKKEKNNLKLINKATVLIKSTDNTFSKTGEIQDSDKGIAFKDVPISQNMIVQVSKKKYKTYITAKPTSFPPQDTVLVIDLELLDECQADCTKNDGICHEECDGVEDPDTGDVCNTGPLTVNNKYLCENAKQGWSIELKSNQNKDNDKDTKVKGSDKEKKKTVEKVYCCEKAPENEEVDQLSVKTGKVENLQTFSTLLVLPDGTPGVMYITLWDDNG